SARLQRSSVGWTVGTRAAKFSAVAREHFFRTRSSVWSRDQPPMYVRPRDAPFETTGSPGSARLVRRRNMAYLQRWGALWASSVILAIVEACGSDSSSPSSSSEAGVPDASTGARPPPPRGGAGGMGAGGVAGAAGGGGMPLGTGCTLGDAAADL